MERRPLPTEGKLMRKPLLLACLLVALTGAWPARAATRLTVRYRSAANIYLDGGRDQGLAVGDRLVVTAGRETVGELEVVYVADQSASCRIVRETRPLRAGDVATLKARPAPPAPAPAAVPPAPAPPPVVVEPAPATASALAAASAADDRPQPWARARGGVSVGFYKVDDQTPSAYDFEQRTARFDLTLSDISGRPLSFTTRLRSRQDVRARTLSSFNPQDERQDRVYELALRYEPPSQSFAFEAGRIGISRFVGIGYLDGALFRYQVAPGLHLGAFGGQRADPDGVEVGGKGPKYGAFVGLAPGGRWARSWEIVLAGVREMAADDVSREYLSAESRFGSGSKWNLYQRAEIDWNRGWRLQASNGRTFQLSNLSVGANLRLSPSASASLSYDNRRNYRSHLNRSVPETFFDDLTRQGLRAGLYLGRGNGLSGSVGGGLRLAESGGKNTYSGSASVRHGNLLGGRLYLGADGSGYSGGFGDGLMLSGRVGRRFGAGHTLDLSYTRSLYRVADTQESRHTQWLRLSGRGELGHGVYLLGDLEYDQGDDLKGPRAFVELGYQF